MGARLVIKVRKDENDLFDIYMHWGANTWDEVNAMCRLAAVYGRDDDIQTLIGKTIGALDEGCGLYMPDTDEREAVEAMAEKGLAQATDRNSGLIAFTPKAMRDFERDAQDILWLDIAQGAGCIADTLMYEGPDIEDEDEAVRMPGFFHTDIDKDNAMDILRRFEDVDDEIFLYNGVYWSVQSA